MSGRGQSLRVFPIEGGPRRPGGGAAAAERATAQRGARGRDRARLGRGRGAPPRGRACPRFPSQAALQPLPNPPLRAASPLPLPLGPIAARAGAPGPTRHEIRSAADADGERVNLLRPVEGVGRRLAVLDGDGGDEGGVEAAGEEDAWRQGGGGEAGEGSGAGVGRSRRQQGGKRRAGVRRGVRLPGARPAGAGCGRAPKGTSAMRRLTTALMSVARISSRFAGLVGMMSWLIQLGLYQRTCEMRIDSAIVRFNS